MSSTNRTTARGGKGSKGDTATKTQKTDKNETGKGEKNKSGMTLYETQSLNIFVTKTVTVMYF